MVTVDGLPLEFRPEGTVVFLRNRDVPGVVGSVGSILGEGGVNIANFSLARGAGKSGRGGPRCGFTSVRRGARPPAARARGRRRTGGHLVSASRLRVVVLFGGRSVEREVSRISARTIAGGLDPSRYDVVPIAVGADGRFLPSSDSARLLAEAGGGRRSDFGEGAEKAAGVFPEALVCDRDRTGPGGRRVPDHPRLLG